MAILGIDPGTLVTGYGIIEQEGNSYRVIDFGCIKPPASLKLTDRYVIIHDSIEELVLKHAPTAVVLEMQFIQAKKNIQSIMKLCMARGIAMIAAKKQGVPIFEYSPCKAKQAVTGNGQASKEQVQGMIKLLFNLPHLVIPADAADALSLAICHANSVKNQQQQEWEV